jgi:uncharacterized protein (DUF2141 family)
MDTIMTRSRRTLFTRTLLAAALLCGSALNPAVASIDATVRLDISGVRNDKGDVGCLLFSAAEGYPEDHTKALREKHTAIAGDRAVCEFDRLAPGTYAAMVWHDENRNGKMDRNFMGIPQEGYGASNNVRPRFSAPGFKEASFVVSAGAVTRLNIQMGY